MADIAWGVIPLGNRSALKALVAGPDWQKHVARAKYERELCERVGLKDRIFHSADFMEKCDPGKFYPAVAYGTKEYDAWVDICKVEGDYHYTTWPELPDKWNYLPLEAIEELREPIDAGMFESIVLLQNYSSGKSAILAGVIGKKLYPIVFFGAKSVYEGIQEKLKKIEEAKASEAEKQKPEQPTDFAKPTIIVSTVLLTLAISIFGYCRLVDGHWFWENPGAVSSMDKISEEITSVPKPCGSWVSYEMAARSGFSGYRVTDLKTAKCELHGTDYLVRGLRQYPGEGKVYGMFSVPEGFYQSLRIGEELEFSVSEKEKGHTTWHNRPLSSVSELPVGTVRHCEMLTCAWCIGGHPYAVCVGQSLEADPPGHKPFTWKIVTKEVYDQVKVGDIVPPPDPKPKPKPQDF